MLFSTSQLTMSAQIFESIMHNMPKSIKKFHAKISFKTQQQYRNFLLEEMHRKEASEQQSITYIEDDDDSCSNQDQDQAVLGIKEVQPEEKPEKMEIQIGLPISIVLKTYFWKDIEDIARLNHVKIMIIPEKVNIIANNTQSISQAAQSFQLIRQRLQLHLIHKFGREINQSEHFKKELELLGVSLIEILNKYYFWFQTSQDPLQEKFIGQLIQKTFQTSCHYLYFFNKKYDFTDKINEKRLIFDNDYQGQDYQSSEKKIYKRLLRDVKGSLFKKKFKSELNPDHEEDWWIEISLDKESLVIHCVAKEQIEVQVCMIEQKYANYRYFYLTFQQEDCMNQIIEMLDHHAQLNRKALFKKNKQVEDNNPIPKISQQDNIFFETNAKFEAQNIPNSENHDQETSSKSKDHKVVCIAFKKQKKSQYSQEELQSHPIVILLQDICKISMSFCITLNEIYKPQNNQSIFSFEYERLHRVTHISPKIKSFQKFKELMKNHILNVEVEKVFVQKEQQNESVNISNKIEDSSLMLNSMNQSKMLNDSLLKDISSIVEKEGAKILPEDINKSNKLEFHQTYNIYFKQSQDQSNNRYDENEKQISKGSRLLGQALLEKCLLEKVGEKFMFYKVKISQKHKINLEEQLLKLQLTKQQISAGLITVFAKSKPEYIKPYNKDKPLPIYLIQNSRHLKCQGFLINTHKKCISEGDKGQLEVKYGTYQATKSIKHVS